MTPRDTEAARRAEIAELLARMQTDLEGGRSDPAALDALGAEDPAQERRLRRLEEERARLTQEVRILRRMASDHRSRAPVLEERRRDLERRFSAVERAEARALLDAYMTDTGGEGD